jgi:hypothetical protein
VAESWLNMLTTDAVQWNHPANTGETSDRAGTAWLSSIATSPGSGGWTSPAYRPALQFGPYFDALGNPLATSAGAQFCANIRLSWLYPETSGHGSVRAEVRVYWLRDEAAVPSATTHPCDELPDTITAKAGLFHVVQQATTLRENTDR